MSENMKAFLDAIKNDEELQKKVNAIDEKEQEELKGHIAEFIALAKEAGITLTEEDFISSNGNELGDEELQAVTGGEDDNDNDIMACFIGGGSDYSECHCPVYGQSTGCGCFLAGISVTG